MRTRVSKFAHFLERIGLAMAGAASGLFVAAHTGSSISALTSQAFLLIMMVGGAVGFYLGIDTPQLALDSANGEKGNSRTRIDAAELLTATGTFSAALTAGLGVASPAAWPRTHLMPPSIESRNRSLAHVLSL